MPESRSRTTGHACSTVRYHSIGRPEPVGADARCERTFPDALFLQTPLTPPGIRKTASPEAEAALIAEQAGLHGVHDIGEGDKGIEGIEVANHAGAAVTAPEADVLVRCTASMPVRRAGRNPVRTGSAMPSTRSTPLVCSLKRRPCSPPGDINVLPNAVPWFASIASGCARCCGRCRARSRLASRPAATPPSSCPRRPPPR